MMNFGLYRSGQRWGPLWQVCVNGSTGRPRGGAYPGDDGATNTCHSERASPRESRRIRRG